MGKMAYIFGFFRLIWESAMNYTSVKYLALVILSVLFYYMIPRKYRWCVLLLSGIFFLISVSDGVGMILVFLFSALITWLAGLGIGKKEGLASIAILIFGITAAAIPLIFNRILSLMTTDPDFSPGSWIAPVGLSFYTLQSISYLADIHTKKILPQKNPLRYLLYISFFPILIQGPISRYDQLAHQLYDGHPYRTENIMRGIQSVLWGLFLKFMIADKAAVFVDAVFGGETHYTGFYILCATVLYSIQLYTDFLSCVTISQGVSELFGIHLTDNFRRPYFSASIREFWRRWHISLSEWLRDYIYIPLGGNRKGKFRKYINLLITFTVSGFWHGAAWSFMVWSWLHAGYMIIGDLIRKPKDRVLKAFSLPQESRVRHIFAVLVTFLLSMTAWVFFRAGSVEHGLFLLRSMFASFNPWVLVNGSLFRLGLSQSQFMILILSILFMALVSHVQEKGIVIRDVFNRQNTVIRWSIYLLAIWGIWILGSYGFGFDSNDFIYGGF